jgi:beta-phosphoglucomutase-like phosphatase (HAD superfamily)
VDTEELYFLATAEITLTQEMFIDLLLTQRRGAWHLAEAKGLASTNILVLRNQRDVRYLELLGSKAKIMDGVEEVLKILYGKHLMGVVTSSHREHFDFVHRRTGLMKYFAFVLACKDYNKFKPDPGHIPLQFRRLVLKQKNVLP